MLLALTACSPTFNWRELRVDSTPLQALMPCKPETATRQVPLGDVPTELHMHSCETGDLRFAVAWADVGQATQAAPALAAWRAASLRAIQAEGADWPAQLPGADAVLGVKGQGVDPQGHPVQTQVLYFAGGTRVFQAAVYGQSLPQEVLDAFFSGLRLPAP